MTDMSPMIVTLTEYEPTFLAPHELPEEIAELLYRDYRDTLDLEGPAPKTNWHWQLTSKGWVGHIPVTPDFRLIVQPKVPVGNLFRMLEYAYQLKSFHFLDGLTSCDSLSEFYERLANVLAKRILDRERKGLYRNYFAQEERLPFVRGRLNIRHSLQTPWAVRLDCRYEEHSADLEENQLLLWTLWRILRSGMCGERVLPTVRRAYRCLQGVATLRNFQPGDCLNRLYNRLNEDYRSLHALCRFFLEQSGPSHQHGDRTMLPFLIDMARLYERFVAEWLKQHLPYGFLLQAQEKVVYDEGQIRHFNIDLVLSNSKTGEVWVLDTKYKAPKEPSQADINQMTAYAVVKNCQNAVLVYPTALKQPIETLMGSSHIHVQSLTFALDGDLESAGLQFLHALLKKKSNSPNTTLPL